MGNTASSGHGRRNNRRRNQNQSNNQPEIPAGNRYIIAATMPYVQYPNPNPPQYYYHAGYYQPTTMMSSHLPAPLDDHHRTIGDQPGYVKGWRNPVIEQQKAVTIRNDVNLKKETLMIEPDEENPGKYLVAFTFDATVAGSITVLFFAKEGLECNLTPTKETLLAPVTVSFRDGLNQKFKQPPGTGIDFSMFQELELMRDGETEVYPLAVKAEACPIDKKKSAENDSVVTTTNSQITHAVFEKKNEGGEYQVRVVKQMLWVDGTRYELQEIYGIQNSVDGDFEGNDAGKECVVCLSELRNTTALPCRHMCLCSECAKVLRYQTNRCPICRQLVDRLLEIKVNNKGEDDPQAPHC